MTLLAHAESRRRNLGSVLRLVHERGPMRQVEISDKLGLTRSTGISLIEELVSLRLVVEQVAEPIRQRGRPSPVIAPCKDVVVVAAEIAAVSARVDIVELGGSLAIGQDLDISPAQLGPQPTLRRVVSTVTELLAARPTLRVVGVAVAVHGAVDDKGRIVLAPNLGWEGADISAIDGMLRRALPGQTLPPVVVGNDADLGALGELRRGAGRSHRDFLYLSAERGIGGGLVVNGEVVRGASGLAGEVGHMKVSRGSHACACGQRGCWETEIGASAIERIGKAASVDKVLELANANERLAAKAINHVATWLGHGLGLLIPVLQPDAIVVGGHLTRITQLARPVIDAAIKDTCPPRLTKDIAIVPSQLGKDAALIGAAEVAFTHLLADPAGAEREIRAGS